MIEHTMNYGHRNTAISIILGLFQWVSLPEIDIFVRILAGLGSFVAAIMAIRYYIKATPKK